MYKYLIGWETKTEPDSSQWHPVTGQDKKDRLKYKKFHINIRKTFFYCKHGQALRQAQRGCGISVGLCITEGDQVVQAAQKD